MFHKNFLVQQITEQKIILKYYKNSQARVRLEVGNVLEFCKRIKKTQKSINAFERHSVFIT